jgi:hypothetical protein
MPKGRAGLLVAVLGGAAAVVAGVFMAHKGDWDKQIEVARGESQEHFNPAVAKLVDRIDVLRRKIERVEDDQQIDEAEIQTIDSLKAEVDRLASVSRNVSPDMAKAAGIMQGLTNDLVGKAFQAMQVVMTEGAADGEVTKSEETDTERLNGLKKFFNKLHGDQMVMDSSTDGRLKKHIRGFVERMNKKYGPEFWSAAPDFNEENIYNRGTYEMVSKLHQAYLDPRTFVNAFKSRIQQGD